MKENDTSTGVVDDSDTQHACAYWGWKIRTRCKLICVDVNEDFRGRHLLYVV